MSRNNFNIRQYLIPIPYLGELIGVKLKIDTIGKRDRSAVSDFHWQILKSRQMIFEIPEILVTKSVEQRHLFAIMTKEFYYGQRIFKNFLQAHNISIIYENPVVSITLFQFCFEYTMQARFSPHWNYMNGLFIKGKYFITEKEPLDTVEVKISLENEETLSVKIKGFRTKMPPPLLEDFCLNAEQLDNFKNKTIERISFDKKNFVKLPSMLPGEVNCIFNRIPKSCPLRSYNDIRRHWKNMYGYRLPSSGDGVYYVNVRVKLGAFVDEKCYPHICGRWLPIQHLNAENPEKIIDAFVNAFEKIMGYNTCNHSIQLEPFGNQSRSMTQDITQNISLCTPTLRPASSLINT